MIIYISLALATVIIACLMQKSPEVNIEKGIAMRLPLSREGITRRSLLNAIGMGIIFTMLFVVSALRINVGNDYAKYVEFMHLAWAKQVVPTEWGFNTLTCVIYDLFGYENFLMVFAIFAFATIFFFLLGIWQQSESFKWSFFMFMALGYYYQSISTVRYYLALGIALYSIKYVISRDWPRFVVCVLIGSLFHKSMLVILVLYVLAQLPWKKWMLGIAAAFCLSFVFLQEQYLKLAVILYPSYEDTEYITEGTSVTVLWSEVDSLKSFLSAAKAWTVGNINVFRCLAVLILSLYLYKKAVKDNRRNLFYFYCNLMALAIYVFCTFIPFVSRIGFYLTVTHILFVPTLINQIDDDKKRFYIKIAVIVACIGYFVMYMRGAGNDGVRILPYQTFLFHDMPPILSETGY
ncbi:MAG: EpsG family protein [Butyrivibrio sp.]|nr:EpsG family protein [Butyrivibrio sp.]